MTEIIKDAAVEETIGEKRYARDLKRGDHVRLGDGRWVLLLSKPTVGLAVAGDGRLGASVSVQMRHTEGASWEPDEKVFSRTPAEQIRHVQTVFASMRPGAGSGGAA